MSDEATPAQPQPEPVPESPKTTEADRQFIHSAVTGHGLVKLTPELLEELSEAAQATSDIFNEMAKKLLTEERAAFVRKLRVDEEYSWRAVAETCFIEWEGEWSPPSNQIMGMILCEQSAEQFGEHYMRPPWN